MIRRFSSWIACALVLSALPLPARAEFLVSSAIIEFNAGGPQQQDIEIISRSGSEDYIVSEISEIVHPGLPGEKRVVISDPVDGALLVTPDKTVLPGGGRKVLRFVLLKAPDAQERIYRVAVKPVIRGVQNSAKLGLKVLIGYEVLVIIRPDAPSPHYTATRKGKSLQVHNDGNVNILFQAGRQCEAEEKCPLPPVVRVYPGEMSTIALPLDKPVTYSLWDGQASVNKTF